MIRWLLISFGISFFTLAGHVAAQVKDDTLIQFTGAVVAGDSLKAIPFTHIIDRTNGFSTITDFYGYFSFVAEKHDTI